MMEQPLGINTVHTNLENPKGMIKSRIESDTKMAEELKERGHISEYEVYQDKHGFEERNIDHLSPEMQGYYEILLMQMKGSVLKDKIEDNDHGVIDKAPRQKIREALFDEKIVTEKGEVRPKYDFYESNKLQQSNVANILSILEAVSSSPDISEGLKTEIRELKEDFSNPKEGEEASPVNTYGFSHPRYKYVLDNHGRYDFVRRLENVTEKTLLEILETGGK